MSRYSKKHYEDIAGLISQSTHYDNNRIARMSDVEFIDGIIKLFINDNPQFDPNRFLKACVVTNK